MQFEEDLLGNLSSRLSPVSRQYISSSSVSSSASSSFVRCFLHLLRTVCNQETNVFKIFFYCLYETFLIVNIITASD